MSADAGILDRIDIRWSVRTRSLIDTRLGKAIAHGAFSMRLGTYSGPTTQRIMADNINARGVHEGDIETVSCIDGSPSDEEVLDLLNARGIRPEDIVEMIIQDVIVDDASEVAASIREPGR